MARFLLSLILAVILVPAAAGADSWDNQFGLRGFPSDPTNGTIYDLVVIGGDLYAVGAFTTIGAASAQCIARWDGNTWSNVGPAVFGNSPITPTITTVAGTPDSLVVVGNFDTVNGAPGEMAIWNGTSWTGFHDPLLEQSQWLFSVASDGSNIYIAGDYPSFVTKWDGASVTQIGIAGGTSNLAIWDLLWYNGGLVAGGNYHTMNGAPAYHLAFWDGDFWTNLQTDLPYMWPGELFEHNGALYMCGARAFDYISNRYLINGQWFDATTDEAQCALIGASTDAMFFQDKLYRTMVCGSTVPGGVPVNGVCKWTGSAWDNMDGGLSAGATAGPLAEYQGNLIVGGEFTAAGGMPAANHLAVWDGERWLANAPDKRVRALATSGTDVYLGGDFIHAYDTPASHVVRWDGNGWSALGTGVNGTVHALLMMGSDLYVAGEFTNAGGSGAAYLARWDGANWFPVGPSLGGPVYALATDGTNLYAGGSFLSFQTEVLQKIGRWDGATWHAIGGGITNTGSVRALTWDGANLYAGGDFAYAGGMPVGNTAYFDGASWNTMAFGFDGMVRDLQLHGGLLYAAGDFVHWGLDVMNHVAAWNGSLWQKVGDPGNPGVDGSVRALASSGGWLFASGEFTHAGGTPASRIASWDGMAWSPLGSGLDRPADALAMGEGELFVGGEFATAGGNGSYRFARWALTPTAVVSTPPTRAAMLEPAIPNPFNPSTQIRYRVATDSRVTIGIYDVAGRRVRLLVDEFVAGSTSVRSREWDGTADNGARAASGVFFVRMQAGGATETQKIVLLK
jgi:hypothetical protein